MMVPAREKGPGFRRGNMAKYFTQYLQLAQQEPPTAVPALVSSTHAHGRALSST